MKSLKSIKVNAVSNIPPSQIVLGMITTSILGVLFTAGLNASGAKRGACWILALLVLGMYALFFFREKRFHRTKIAVRFYLRALRGETRIAKYVCDLSCLKRYLPIEEVHDGGLIQFTYMRYGVLVKIKPSRGDEEDLEAHNKRVEALINTLHGSLMMKVIVGTRVDPARPLDQVLLDAANEHGKSKEQRDHLYELYLENHAKGVGVDWTSYVFIGLGEHHSENKARVVMNSVLPGMLKAMSLAGIDYSVLSGEDDVLLAFRELMVSRRLR